VQLRTFVAVELDDACRGALATTLEGLRRAAEGVRWVRPEALHLTLKFIGELAEADLPEAIECLAEAASGVSPFVMSVGGIGGFPPRGKPRIVHVGVREESGELLRLQETVESVLKREMGVAREKRRYVPHITVGRVRQRRSCPTVEEIAELAGEQEFGRVGVGSFVLMKSDLRPTGAVYTPLNRFALG
jgi:2'-5' RNA ligase